LEIFKDLVYMWSIQVLMCNTNWVGMCSRSLVHTGIETYCHSVLTYGANLVWKILGFQQRCYIKLFGGYALRETRSPSQRYPSNFLYQSLLSFSTRACSYRIITKIYFFISPWVHEQKGTSETIESDPLSFLRRRSILFLLQLHLQFNVHILFFWKLRGLSVSIEYYGVDLGSRWVSGHFNLFSFSNILI
jgi:hypothetical protein